MQIEYDPEINDYLVPQKTLAAHLRISDRQVRNLRDSGVLIEEPCKNFMLIENVHRYGQHKYSGGSTSDSGKSEDELRREKLFEEGRKLKHENDLREGLVDSVEKMVAVVRPIISSLSQRIDLLPSIAADACKEVDGRGRERMAKALIDEKNELARIPDLLLAATEAGAG